MSNVRDIIEAATPGPWRWGLSEGASDVRGAENKLVLSSWAWEEGAADVDCDYADATFIATFDPEHVALMEAVCDVARECSGDAAGILSTALSDLDAYRRERWYSGQ